MALTAESSQQCEAAGLTSFLDENRPLFTAMVRTAYDYAAGFVAGTGQPVRSDDVAQALDPALRVCTALVEFLAARRLTQKYWYTRFGDLVIDQLWEELSTHDPDATAPN